jgi:two-component system, LytTR family, sensor kinase
VSSFQLLTPQLSWWDAMLGNLFFMPLSITASYCTILLVKKFFFSKKYALFTAFLLVSMIGFTIINRAISFYLLVPYFYPELVASYHSQGFFHFTRMVNFGISIYSVVAFASVFTFILEWYDYEKARQQLENEKLEAELRFLRGQIHPHFLFNMLNNLYALSLKKSDQTPGMILKISSLLDYMLHEAMSPSVTLQREIEVLQDYISMERIRYGDRIDIQTSITGDIDGKRIAPLLLFPFVENSFKHGASQELDNPRVNLAIRVLDDVLFMKLENSKSKILSERQTRDSGGIGCNNVRRRLDLLYPHAYELIIADEERLYAVDLKLNLTNSYERLP